MEVNSTNYKKYMSKNILKQICLKRFINKITDIMENDDKNCTLLDVGCGEGFISDVIYNKTAIKNIEAIDINKECIEFAKKQNDKIKYKHYDLYNLDYKKNTYDIVILLEVLEHLERPEECLKIVNSISKSKLVISIPDEPFFSLGNFLSFKNIKRLGRPIDHINFWNKNSITKFLIKVGINDFKIYKSFPWIIIVINK